MIRVFTNKDIYNFYFLLNENLINENIILPIKVNFAIQKNFNILLELSEEIENSTYVLETKDGVINVKNLPPGEYRFVEKQAPEGYDIIKDKDSNAVFTISDKGIFGKDGKPVTDYYQVKLVNQKTKVEGSYDSAELIVTIITGRKVANYTLIIAGLAVLLTVLIIIRKKSKK